MLLGPRLPVKSTLSEARMPRSSRAEKQFSKSFQWPWQKGQMWGLRWGLLGGILLLVDTNRTEHQPLRSENGSNGRFLLPS